MAENKQPTDEYTGEEWGDDFDDMPEAGAQITYQGIYEDDIAEDFKVGDEQPAEQPDRYEQDFNREPAGKTKERSPIPEAKDLAANADVLKSFVDEDLVKPDPEEYVLGEDDDEYKWALREYNQNAKLAKALAPVKHLISRISEQEANNTREKSFEKIKNSLVDTVPEYKHSKSIQEYARALYDGRATETPEQLMRYVIQGKLAESKAKISRKTPPSSVAQMGKQQSKRTDGVDDFMQELFQ